MSFKKISNQLYLLKHLFLFTFLISTILFVGCSSNPSKSDEPTLYSINVTLSPSESGTITPDVKNMVEEGDKIELQANPNDGYVFSGWAGDVESSNNPLSITANKNLELVANFALRSYELSINVEGEGTVDEQIIQQKTTEFEHGTVVKLTATPAQGWKFSEWKGDLTGFENPSTITISEPLSITAVFEKEPITVEDIPAIDNEVASFMAKYGVKGVSLAVTKNGRLVYAKGYGYANVATNTRVDTTSLFRIASLSKFITATGIMKLIEDGKLTMEQKVFGPGAIFEDEYGTTNLPKYVDEIRVRDLLYHELGGWNNSGSIDPAFAKPAYNAMQVIYWTMRNYGLDKKPGTAYEYSNIGYMILGEIIEKISGEDYEDYIRENILVPSGVTNMKISNDSASGRQPNEVQYYSSSGPIGYDTNGVIRRLGSAGGWIASPIDLVRILTHIDGFDTVPDILKSETIKLLSTPSPISDYASGFRINSNSKNWWHSGSLTGTAAWIVRTPRGYTWSILTNTSATGITTGLNSLIWPAVSSYSTNWTDGDLF
ncbi:MAG: serine hydrolase [Balneolaceae bacterium]